MDGRRPPFNYNLSWRVAFSLYRGELSLDAALEACRRLRVKAGIRSNSEVVKVIWEDAARANFLCRPLKERPFAIRHDMAIPVRPRFYIVRNGQPHIFWLQPWKKFELTTEQLGVLASVIKHTYVVDDFEKADLYLLDASADEKNGPRKPAVLSFSDLPLLSDEQLSASLGRFVKAYNAFLTNRKPQQQQPRGRKPDSGQTDLFDR